MSETPSDATGAAAAAVGSVVSAASPWAALALAAAESLKAFVQTFADARQIEATGLKSAAQTIADRISARAAASNKTVTP